MSPLDMCADYIVRYKYLVLRTSSTLYRTADGSRLIVDSTELSEIGGVGGVDYLRYKFYCTSSLRYIFLLWLFIIGPHNNHNILDIITRMPHNQ